MKKFHAFFIVLLLGAFELSRGISINYEWVKQIGGPNAEYANCIALDQAKNIYIAGYFLDTTDFDPGPNVSNLIAAGGRDIFIAKYSANGSLLWVQKIGGTTNDEAKAITVDSENNIYITGYFEGTVDFNPHPFLTSSLTSNGGKDIFVCKFNSSGAFQWVRRFGGSGEDEGKSITIDRKGNIISTGVFYQTVDFNPGPETFNLTSSGSADVYISKLDGEGNFIWAKKVGGTDAQVGNSVAVDTNKNIYIGGNFYETADFDPGTNSQNLTSKGWQDGFLLKLDSAGNYLWVKQIGGKSFDNVAKVSIDAFNNVFITGYISDSIDLDLAEVTDNYYAPTKNTIICKFSSSGNFKWVKYLKSNSINEGIDILADDNGDINVLGYLNGLSIIDTDSIQTNGNTDIYYIKIRRNGTVLYTSSFGGIQYDSPGAIAIDNMGNKILGGSFSAKIGFNTINHDTLSSVGANDIFILKFSECENTYDTIDVTACYKYVSPSGNYTWTQGGTYTDILPNSKGCDSLITINLTINRVTNITTTVSNGITITANNSNATYRWLNCNNNYSVINNQTQQSFTPTTNGSYAVELTENGCVDTSACVSITAVSISNENVEKLQIGPNPTNGEITIKFGHNVNKIQVIVKNVLGSIVLSQEILANEPASIFINGPSGIYVIEVIANNKRSIHKIIKT